MDFMFAAVGGLKQEKVLLEFRLLLYKQSYFDLCIKMNFV